MGLGRKRFALDHDMSEEGASRPDGTSNEDECLEDNLGFLDHFLEALNDVYVQHTSSSSTSSSASTTNADHGSNPSGGGSSRPTSVEPFDFLGTRLGAGDGGRWELEELLAAPQDVDVQERLRLNRAYYHRLADVVVLLGNLSRATVDLGQQLKRAVAVSVVRRSADQDGPSSRSSMTSSGEYPPSLTLVSPDQDWQVFVQAHLSSGDLADNPSLRQEAITLAKQRFLWYHVLPEMSRRRKWTSSERTQLLGELQRQLQKHLLDDACARFAGDVEGLSRRLRELERAGPAKLLLDYIPPDPMTLSDSNSSGNTGITSQFGATSHPTTNYHGTTSHRSFKVDWARISTGVFGGRRTGGECQRAWAHDLSRRLRPPLPPDFTPSEEDVVRRCHQARVPYADLARQLPGRSFPEIMRVWRHLSASTIGGESPGMPAGADAVQREQRVGKGRTGRGGGREGRWTPEEDAKLRDVVETRMRSVVLDWSSVSALLPGRSAVQCQARYTRALAPSLCKGRWSAREDDQLREAMQAHLEEGKGVHDDDDDDGQQHQGDDEELGPSVPWHVISRAVPTRSDVQCRERWVNVLDPQRIRGHWSSGEDQRLLQAVDQYGPKWSVVSRAAFGARRTDNDCLRRHRLLSRRRSQNGEQSGASPSTLL